MKLLLLVILYKVFVLYAKFRLLPLSLILFLQISNFSYNILTSLANNIPLSSLISFLHIFLIKSKNDLFCRFLSLLLGSSTCINTPLSKSTAKCSFNLVI